MRGATSKRSGSAFGDDASSRSSSTKKKKKSVRRKHTVSIAVPGSIVNNAQTLELATSLAGQIARAAAIFQVDEICVYDEPGEYDRENRERRWKDAENETGGSFLYQIFEYLDTPQYLRRALIPLKPYFRFAGLLPPLDAPHHARANENVPFREGVIVLKKAEGKIPKPTDSKEDEKMGQWVNVGLQKEVKINKMMPIGTRVTVSMRGKTIEQINSSAAAVDGDDILRVVHREYVREKKGLYWGFSIRYAKGLNQVLSESSFHEKYDYVIGTSEHGVQTKSSELTIPSFTHLLIVFGGLAGLEESMELDPLIKIKDSKRIFDLYLNTCTAQGSRTIRTEEAVTISLAFLKEPISRAIEYNI